MESAPAAQMHAPSRGALARDHVDSLRGALHELAECRKLIDAALVRSA